MGWSCYLCDTMTGLVGEPIDVPRISYRVTASDSSMRTGDRDAGDTEVSSVELPWSCLPAATPEGRDRAIRPMSRSLLLCWHDGGGREVPVAWGAIGSRTDTWTGARLTTRSPLDLLSRRVLCDEGSFGSGHLDGQKDADYQHDGEQPGTVWSTTQGGTALSGLSLRGIACAVGERLTRCKPGGELPIDWQYAGEPGAHVRSYRNFNVSNNGGRKLLEAISQVSDGIDMRFRPYMADEAHVRLAFEAGSDSERYLAQAGLVQTLTCFPGGGTLDSVRVARSPAAMRVYATGAGQDEAQLGHLSEDLALCRMSDPVPLAEATLGDSDWATPELVREHADAALAAASRPLCQLQGTMHLSDPQTPRMGSMWPGDLVDVDLRGHPSMPDGTYRMRLMEMSGDSGDDVELTFDAIEDPWYAREVPYR